MKCINCSYELNPELHETACPACGVTTDDAAATDDSNAVTERTPLTLGQGVRSKEMSVGAVSLTRKPDVFRSPWLLVAFLLDVSGSMAGKKLQSAVDGLGQMVQSLFPLREKCSVGICDFNEAARVANELTAPKELTGQLQFGDADGGTNIGAGLRAAEKLLAGHQVDGPANQVVVLLSDGEDTCRSAPVEEATRLKADGKLIVTIGFGADADHDTLRAMASGPELFFAKSNGRELETFLRNLGSTMSASVQKGERMNRSLHRMR